MELLVTGAWSEAHLNIRALTELGHKVHFLRQETDALPCSADVIQGVICNSLFLTHSIEKFTNLRYIQVTSVGLDRVPVDYIKAHRIELHNAGNVYAVPMAEHAVCGVLQLYRNMRRFEKNQRDHRWEKIRDLRELAGRTVCIIGCGNVGRACAKRFKAFDCRITGIARTERDEPLFEHVSPMEELDACLKDADILVLALPLTGETRHLIDRKRLAAMKDGAVLVNIARGALVDPAALCDELNARLGGAVLDVFEEEPLGADSPLWDMENVILTPHNSFAGEGAAGRLSEEIMNNIKRKTVS